MENKYVSLEDILGKDTEALTEVKKGEFDVEKLGTIPYSAIDHKEYKQAKKDCMQMVPNPDKSGSMVPDLDDDKLMLKVIVAAVEKDQRSSFTFANKALLEKLGVQTAEAAVSKLVAPGEIYKWAVDIQNLSGFGQKAQADLKDAVKNS